MKNKLFISIYCGLMILLASCNNYLDVKPKGKIIPETAEDSAIRAFMWEVPLTKIRPLTKHSTLLSKTVIWLSATWMIRNPI